MSATFQYLKGDCPICNGARRDCRQNKESAIIHCRETDANPTGFRLVEEDALGFFMWAESSQTQDQNWQNKLRVHQQPDRQQKLKRLLPTLERDRQFRAIARHSKLSLQHRVKLEQRGLSPASIEQAYQASLLWSWQNGARIPGTTSDLPGVDQRGRLRSYSSGFAIGIPNERGEVLGAQIRTDALGLEDAKYLWLSSEPINGNGIHLPDGEVPIGFYRPVKAIEQAEINVAEGFLKPLIVAQRFGVVCLGAAGANFTSSPNLLGHYLEIASTELQTKQVVLNADAGSVSNTHVLGAYRRFWELVEEWGYSISIRWWGQVEKTAGDIDEIDAATFATAQLLTTAQFEAIADQHLPQQPIREQQRLLERTLQLFSSRNKKKAVAPNLPEIAVSDVYEYLLGARQRTWRRAVQQGYRYILDLSGTGEGKSFDAGNVEPSMLGARQIVYVSEQHRNPTVATLETENGWIDLEARHGGLVSEKTGEGARLRRSNRGETADVPANCSRTHLLGMLRSKNVQGADTASLICGSCPLREACSHTSGRGYGFLNQRRSALASPKLRAHPDSLTDPTEYDYDAVALLWDEAAQSFQNKHDIQVDLQDLQQAIVSLINHPDLFEPVKPILTALLPYLDGSQSTGMYGIEHDAVVTLLGTLATVEPSAIERVLHPNLSFVNSTEEYGVDLADLPPQLRRKFADRDFELAEQAQQQVLKQWLPALLRVLQGSIKEASLHLHRRKLTIAMPANRHRSIANAAKVIIILDATTNREDFADKLGCKPEEIYVCRQQPVATPNLKLLQVADLGRMGMERGQDQQRRAAAIVSHYKQLDPTTRTIDFKKFSDDGAWWRDNRGVNDFLTCRTLILVGTPCPNLNALKAEYAMLKGYVPGEEDEQFKAWVNRRIRAEFIQAIGRLRAHRRLNEDLTIIILSNFNLGLPHIEQVRPVDLTIEAAGKVERFQIAAIKAIEQLKAAGEKVTQTTVATLSGYSQQYLSRHWKLLQTLLESINSKSSNPEPDAEMVPIVEAVAAEPVSEAILGALEQDLYEWIKPRQWAQIFPILSAQAQVNLIAALMMTLPLEQLKGVVALGGT